MWERELRKIKGLYDNRLRASQQKSSKMEQALTNQTYQVNKWMNHLFKIIENIGVSNEFWFPGFRGKLDYAWCRAFFREWADPSNGYHENWVVTPLGYRSINTHPSKTRLKTSIKRRPFGNKTLGVKGGSKAYIKQLPHASISGCLKITIFKQCASWFSVAYNLKVEGGGG